MLAMAHRNVDWINKVETGTALNTHILLPYTIQMAYSLHQCDADIGKKRQTKQQHHCRFEKNPE